MFAFVKKLKNQLNHEEWTVAIREKEENIFSSAWINQPYHTQKNTINYWYADPFVVEQNGKAFLFVEQYNRLHGYADIAVGEIVNNKVKKFKIAYHNKRHLSFPYVFLYENEFYMIPESYSSNRLILLKAKKFPCEWQEVTSIVDKHFLDNVILNSKGQNYLLSSVYNKTGGSDNLFLTKIDTGFKLGESIQVYNKRLDIARNGGRIIQKDNQIIRVAQNCEEKYGASLSFRQILKIGDHTLDEKCIFTYTPNQVVLNKSKAVGVHTYNSSENYEVIDVLIRKKMDFGNLIMSLISHLFVRKR